jgi:hypothetical protein
MPKAILIVRHKEITDDGFVIEIVIWRLSDPLHGCRHPFKYRLYFGTQTGVCIVRYDNERGKGDHRHGGEREEQYSFTTVKTLLADFRRDVKEMV